MRPRTTRTYGLHLMLDGYGASPAKLENVGLLFRTLNELPGRIGMRKVGFPHIIQFTEAHLAGLSGFVFVVESHISIHTYANKGFLSMDVYSCKRFSHTDVVRDIKRMYGIRTAAVRVVQRGRRFPVRDIRR